MQSHSRRLIHLEDPEVNGAWIIHYEIWKPGYDFGNPGTGYQDFKNRVLRSDYAIMSSASAESAENELKPLLLEKYPLSKIRITYNRYYRHSS